MLPFRFSMMSEHRNYTDFNSTPSARGTRVMKTSHNLADELTEDRRPVYEYS